MIREFGRSVGEAVVENVGRALGRAQERKPLPADVLESDDAFLVVFDAPKTTKSDVQVRLREDVLEVRIDRFRDYHEGFEMLYPGRGLSLDGSVRLPAGAEVDADGATASLKENGTLEVRLPKTGTQTKVEVQEEVEENQGTAGDDEEDAAE